MKNYTSKELDKLKIIFNNLQISCEVSGNGYTDDVYFTIRILSPKLNKIISHTYTYNMCRTSNLEDVFIQDVSHLCRKLTRGENTLDDIKRNEFRNYTVEDILQ